MRVHGVAHAAQRPVGRVRASEARAFLAAGEFAVGAMGPKIDGRPIRHKGRAKGHGVATLSRWPTRWPGARAPEVTPDDESLVA